MCEREREIEKRREKKRESSPLQIFNGDDAISCRIQLLKCLPYDANPRLAHGRLCMCMCGVCVCMCMCMCVCACVCVCVCVCIE